MNSERVFFPGPSAASMEGITVRPIRRSDFQEVLKWMTDEGWIGVSTNLLEATVQWDPQGWLVAENEQGCLLGNVLFSTCIGLESILYAYH